ncbi:MAG: hypothetical protein ACI9P5_003658 [Saprospiraceae bacterium]|jgi:hypothetical protein
MIKRNTIMIKIIKTVSFVLLCLQVNSQTLTTELERVNSNITWPWNWDVVSYENKLITVNENGTLNIKINDNWENIEANPTVSNFEPRGLAVDNNGTVWFTSTEHGLWSYDINGELANFTSENSFLPVNNLRHIAIHNNVFWISTDGMGLIKHNIETNETTHFTKAEYSDLKTDFNLDPYIDLAGNVWFSNREFLSKISPSSDWTNEDMRFHISGGNVNDIEIVSESEIWIAMNGGLVLYDGSDYNVIIESQFDNYQQVLKDSKGDIWLSRSSSLNGNGITILHNEQEHFFSVDDNSDIPNQVFEFVEHQDTIIAVGTIGNSISKMVFDFPSSVSNELKETFRVFPNPAYTDLYIDFQGDHNASNSIFTDLEGKTIEVRYLTPKKIDITHLNSGVYILTLKTDSGLISKKVTIANN